MADRNGKEYPDGIAPDEEVLSEATITTNDPVIRAAARWLSGRSACAAQPAAELVHPFRLPRSATPAVAPR